MEQRSKNTIRNICIFGALAVLTFVGARVLLQRNRVANEAPAVVTNTATVGNKASVAQGTAPATAVVQAAPAQGAAPAAVALDGCYTVSFKHKEVQGHGDREACTSHKNSIALAGDVLSALPAKLNPKALCVRVDGIPVKFEPVKGALVIGPVAGPESAITVQACIGKSSCKFNCVVPKDEFMDALGATDDEGRAVASAKWDANDKEEDQDATAGLDDEVKNAGVAVQKLPVFHDWQVTGHSPTCELAKEGS
jgi:hypothetical protein